MSKMPRELKPKTVEILFEKYIKVRKHCVVYFGAVLKFGGAAQRTAFYYLLENLRDGNLPIHQADVLNECRSQSDTLSDLLKRTLAWSYIVRDGARHVWLYIPEPILNQLQPPEEDELKN